MGKTIITVAGKGGVGKTSNLCGNSKATRSEPSECKNSRNRRGSGGGTSHSARRRGKAYNRRHSQGNYRQARVTKKRAKKELLARLAFAFLMRWWKKKALSS